MKTIDVMRRRTPLAVAVVTLALGPAGCQAGPDQPDQTNQADRSAELDRRLDRPQMQRPLPERVTPPEPAGELELPPEAILEPVLAEAAEHSGLARDELTVVQSRRVVWNDGSLGCPEPGMNYTQALVPGWHVLVAAGETTLDYRLSERGHFKRCEFKRRLRGADGNQTEAGKKESPSEEGLPDR